MHKTSPRKGVCYSINLRNLNLDERKTECIYEAGTSSAGLCCLTHAFPQGAHSYLPLMVSHLEEYKPEIINLFEDAQEVQTLHAECTTA